MRFSIFLNIDFNYSAQKPNHSAKDIVCVNKNHSTIIYLQMLVPTSPFLKLRKVPIIQQFIIKFWVLEKIDQNEPDTVLFSNSLHTNTSYS